MQKLRLCDKHSQLISILAIFLLVPQMQCCPYDDYEQSLISIESPINIERFDSFVPLELEESFGFGFWSLCIPQTKYLIEEGNLLILLTQLLFLVKGNSGTSLLGFINLNKDYEQIEHYIYILGDSEAYFQFNYSPINYTDRWILTFITFDFSQRNIIVEMTDQIPQVQKMNEGQDFIQIIQGGRGIIEHFIFDLFKGRLSKVFVSKIEYQDQNLFQYMIDNCQIPAPQQEEQTIYFVKGLQIFEGDTSLQYTVNQFGNKFCVSGWVKYDASRVIDTSIYPLIRISLYKNYFEMETIGDEIFLMKVWLNKIEPKFTKISIYNDVLRFPIIESVDLISVSNILFDTYSQLYFEGLQQWHFVKYEYGSSIQGKKSWLQIQFFNELNLQEIFQDTASPTNSPYYVYLGSDEFVNELLQASLFDFKFEFNYLENKQFLFKVCHYSCQTCNGPLETNCLSCELDSNRYYLNEQKRCKCLQGYIDSQDEKVCQQFEHRFSSVQNIEGSHKGSSLCKFGYFMFSDENGSIFCLKCPQSNIQDVMCVDCIFYPQTWYLKPICKFDLVSQGLKFVDALKFQERDKIDYDFYIINQNRELHNKPGYQDYCEIELDPINCFQAKYQHIGQTIYVKCKPNYYQLNGDCVLTNLNCLQAGLDGSCQKVKDGMYLYNDQYYLCPITCQTCTYDHRSNRPLCQSCFNYHALKDGSCFPCGNKCSVCQEYFDKVANSSYLKCFKCVDDSKYYFSFDGINCLENTINNCQYALQVINNNYKINTFDPYFSQRNDQENIITTCGRCKYGYGIVLKSQICLQMRDSTCYFSYVDHICDTVLNDEILQYLSWHSYYETQSGEKITFALDDDKNNICTSEQYCLISSEYYTQSNILQFSKQCPGFIENCATCIRDKVHWLYVVHLCLECKSGYYAERITGQCYQCPPELNCYNCAQQTKLSKDYWKINIRAFYQFAINSDNKHPFKLYGQSEVKDDYEIICTMCIKGYELLDQQCIKECPDSCLECQILNGQNSCLRCELEQQGRKLSLSNDQCITCPQNCALCRIRSTDEISSINPLFNNQIYFTYTYQCLKSFEDQDYYYDQELGSFISCTNQKDCEQKIIIPINLYCSSQEFNTALNLLESFQEKLLFKQKNVLISDLTSGDSFKEFENDDFYFSANQKLIKTIIINIVSVKQQTCRIQGSAKIQQKFSKNVFSTIYVELNIQLNQNTIIEFNRDISFLNFNKVSIYGGQFHPVFDNKLKSIIFLSKLPQIILLDSIVYQQLTQVNDYSRLIFNDIKKLDIINFKILNLVQNAIDTFIFIADTSYFKQIKLESFQILDSILHNQVTLQFNLNQNDIIQITDLICKGQFYNSTLINTSTTKQFGFLIAQNIDFQIDVRNCLLFLNLYLFKEVTISGLQFRNSFIQNSTLIILNNINYINGLIIKDSKFEELSYGILNSKQLQLKNIIIKLANIVIQDNEYHQTTKFIEFNKYNNDNSKLSIEKFKISSNQITKITSDIKFNTQNSSVIYISLDYIEISELFILRGIGLIDISIVDAKSLRIQSIRITQGNKYIFLGLHQYQDCQLQQVKGEYYLSSLFVTSILNFEIEDMEIKSTYSYNSPILYYKSFDKAKQQQIETMRIQNVIVESNLLILSNSKYQTAIIFVDSVQQINLELSNIHFRGNILHEYVQNNLQISSLLLNLNCILGVISIKNSNFSKNTVYNSTDNIVYIKSYQLEMVNCSFFQNSYFNYQLIQPFLLWGFLETEKVYIEQINQIFFVKSNSGIAQLLIENLKIESCIFEQSQGKSGGALSIQAQKNSIISISNSQFKNISTTYSQEQGLGGAIYLDGTSAYSLEVFIKDLNIQNITAKQYGGFMYILSDSSQINIELKSIKMQDVYAKLGSIIYFTFSSSLTQQYIKVNSFYIQNTNEGYINYLDRYIQPSKTEETAIINNRTLFYVDSSGNVLFNSIQINNLILESVLKIDRATKIQVQNFKISNSVISNKLFQIHPNQYLLNSLLISDLTISNLIVYLLLKNYNCQQKDNTIDKVYFKCLQTGLKKSAPINLLFQYQYQKNTYGECLQTQIKQQNTQENNLVIENTESGLILFLDLTQQSQIKLNNLIFSGINCNLCSNGLIFYSFLQIENQLMKQYISELKVTNSSCGIQGCLQIEKQNSQFTRRFLANEEIYLQSLMLEFFIDNYVCQFNNATNGTCLHVENISILISDSIFQYNNASQMGGAIVAKKNQNILIISSLIQHNSAQSGGGIYLADQQDMDYFKLGTLIDNNKAEFYGNDKASVPQKLTIIVSNKSSFQPTITIQQTEEQLIQQVVFQSTNLNKFQYIYLPSGQKISNYQVFNKNNRSYTPFDYHFRLIALSKDNSVIKNLKNSYCEIDSRILNISNINDNSDFSNNFTNLKMVSFNVLTQDYNLDDLVLYFDNDLPSEIVLQIQFRCNSILIPIYNQSYPFNLISTHSNYKLRANIKTMSCQYGEIKNNTSFSCTPCDSEQGFFSLNLNSEKCELKDDMSTLNVLPALLNLKDGYWRPYFQSNLVRYCFNLPKNCLGGWNEGDNSCFVGHVGALCEECDLYNTRGDGEFSVSQKYSCSSCLEEKQNTIIIAVVSIWTLISILISVQSTLKAIKEYVRNTSIIMIGLTITQHSNQSGILIKMLTNYFQIISSISTFQLNLPAELQSTFNAVGSPIQTMTYSLDCFLSHQFKFEIQYSRMIWQIIMPFIYITFFLLCYLFFVKFKKHAFNRNIITTTLIYMYIYMQPNLIGGFIQLVSYREISGYKWVQSNVSQRFDTTSHEIWILEFCLPMLFILALIIPFYFFYGLYSNSNQLNNKKVRLQWGYLYNEYTKNAYFWEVIKIVQKELMIIFLTYYEDNIIIKATIISIILGIYLELSLKYKPYSLNNLNKLDYYSINVCLASIALAIGIYASEQSNSKEIQIAYAIIISILNLHLIYNLISKIVVEYLQEKSGNFDEKFDNIRAQIRKLFPYLNEYSCFRRILANRREEKERIQKLFTKLKQFLIPQARKIIAFKNRQFQLAIETNMEQNIDTVPFSLKSLTQVKEKQSLARQTIRENSLYFSKKTNEAFDREKIKQKKLCVVVKQITNSENYNYDNCP